MMKVKLKQIETFWELVYLTTKYSFQVEDKIFESNIKRLTNQLWKLIPMRENGEDWKSQLNTVIIEIAGLSEIFNIGDKYLILLSKLEGLLQRETQFIYYRKTVFEAISLLGEYGRSKE